MDPEQRKLIQRTRELTRSDCSVTELQECIGGIFCLNGAYADGTAARKNTGETHDADSAAWP